MKIDQLHALFLECNKVSTDTRKIEVNDMFFGLKGEYFDGNIYAKEALDKGAKYAVIDNEEYHLSQGTILVEDTLNCLQQLATYHRNVLNVPIIALTGSNGKTTTKELINAVLSQKFKTTATQGNFNNHIGVPLTLLRMSSDTEMGIVEMGANHRKEIEFLCQIARPDYGYITNFGKAHLEGFGGVKGVIKGKSELYDFLIAHNKHIFINADDAIQLEKTDTYNQRSGFSEVNEAFLKITLSAIEPFIKFKIDGVEIESNLIGVYNFPNLCAAALIGKHFDVTIQSIKNGIQSYVPENNRSQIIKRGHITIILDAYNANPSSMTAALDHLAQTKDTNRMAILGDMFELGETAIEEHRNIANHAQALNIDQLYLVGTHFCDAMPDYPLIYKTLDDLKTALKSPKDSTTILIKGSRGMALERILDLI